MLEWSWLFGIVKGTAFEVYRKVGDGDMLRELPIQAAEGLKEMRAYYPRWFLLLRAILSIESQLLNDER